MDKYMKIMPNFGASKLHKKRGAKEQRKHKQQLRQDFFNQTLRLVTLSNMVSFMHIRQALQQMKPDLRQSISMML